MVADVFHCQRAPVGKWELVVPARARLIRELENNGAGKSNDAWQAALATGGDRDYYPEGESQHLC